MIKKPLLKIVSVAIMFNMFGSFVSASSLPQESSFATVGQTSSDYILIGNDQHSKEIFKNSALISPYVTFGSDNLLHISLEARSVVDEDVFSSYQLGVNRINQAINEGCIQIKNGELVLNESEKHSRYKRSYSNTYWWGVAVTFNDEETKEQIYSLQQSGQLVTLLAAIVASLPGGPASTAAAAVVAGAFVAVTSSMVANSMSNHNKGNGVTLNIHWAPAYYEVTSN